MSSRAASRRFWRQIIWKMIQWGFWLSVRLGFWEFLEKLSTSSHLTFQSQLSARVHFMGKDKSKQSSMGKNFAECPD